MLFWNPWTTDNGKLWQVSWKRRVDWPWEHLRYLRKCRIREAAISTLPSVAAVNRTATELVVALRPVSWSSSASCPSKRRSATVISWLSCCLADRHLRGSPQQSPAREISIRVTAFFVVARKRNTVPWFDQHPSCSEHLAVVIHWSAGVSCGVLKAPTNMFCLAAHDRAASLQSSTAGKLYCSTLSNTSLRRFGERCGTEPSGTTLSSMRNAGRKKSNAKNLPKNLQHGLTVTCMWCCLNSMVWIGMNLLCHSPPWPMSAFENMFPMILHMSMPSSTNAYSTLNYQMHLMQIHFWSLIGFVHKYLSPKQLTQKKILEIFCRKRNCVNSFHQT